MNDPIFQRSTNKSSNSSSHSHQHQHQHTDLSNGNNSHHPNHNFHLDMDQRQIYQRPSSARVRSSTTNNNSTGSPQQPMMKQRPLSARTRREHSHNYTSGGSGASTARSYDSYQRGGGGGVCDCTGSHFNAWVPRPVKYVPYIITQNAISSAIHCCLIIQCSSIIFFFSFLHSSHSFPCWLLLFVCSV